MHFIMYELGVAGDFYVSAVIPCTDDGSNGYRTFCDMSLITFALDVSLSAKLKQVI